MINVSSLCDCVTHFFSNNNLLLWLKYVCRFCGEIPMHMARFPHSQCARPSDESVLFANFIITSACVSIRNLHQRSFRALWMKENMFGYARRIGILHKSRVTRGLVRRCIAFIWRHVTMFARWDGHVQPTVQGNLSFTMEQRGTMCIYDCWRYFRSLVSRKNGAWQHLHEWTNGNDRRCTMHRLSLALVFGFFFATLNGIY